ncbi:glycosyltransferase family 39 protein [Butyrivibrio proteoclasticus]|uniref:glycosyltransferase family 39 protein n=1 Tax=Butyrivibrio proteoclasticus TaxID=43305 RepID=UPI0004788DC1|nr:glycosyltransferase family 39 protein [Butyrivibrio proteoclasticus]
MLSESSIVKTEKKIYDFLPHEPETMGITLFIIGMAAYYLWRMFAITPQYDELYTYYTFISKGPFYSAIHWPLPNNHVGYSVLSGVLNYFGNSYIGLRGVSFVCAVSNLILIYRISRRYFSHYVPLAATALYASMQVVNEYSVQGRGYTLATTCYLIAIYIIGIMCNAGETKTRYFVMFGISLVLGLYTVPSSVYWVVPTSFAAALYLFINGLRIRKVYKKISDNMYFRTLKTLIITGVLAALATTFLYTIIWLAIGSNLLIKDETSAFYGLSHGTALVRGPVQCVQTGIDYMLNQPYIQSLDPAEFKANYFNWCINLLNYMLPGVPYVLAFFICVSLVVLITGFFRHFEYSITVINLLIVSNVVLTQLMLIYQHKLPYLRVFGYGCVTISLAICGILEKSINVLIRIYNSKETDGVNLKAVASHREHETIVHKEKSISWIGLFIPVIIIGILFFVRFFDPSFSCQLGERENDIFNTMLVADIPNRKNIAVIDCDQQYLLKFGWGIDCTKTDVTDADCVIIDKNLFEPGYSGGDFWKFYQTYETIDWEYIDSMHAQYETDRLILYTK